MTKRPVGHVRVHVGSANSRFKTELSTLECAIVMSLLMHYITLSNHMVDVNIIM